MELEIILIGLGTIILAATIAGVWYFSKNVAK